MTFVRPIIAKKKQDLETSEFAASTPAPELGSTEKPEEEKSDQAPAGDEAEESK